MSRAYVGQTNTNRTETIITQIRHIIWPWMVVCRYVPYNREKKINLTNNHTFAASYARGCAAAAVDCCCCCSLLPLLLMNSVKNWRPGPIYIISGCKCLSSPQPQYHAINKSTPFYEIKNNVSEILKKTTTSSYLTEWGLSPFKQD